MREQRKQEKERRSDEEIVAIIAAALVIGASAKATATKLSPLVGIPVEALLPVVVIGLSKPMKYSGPVVRNATVNAPATENYSNLEYTYRAQYILAASRRVAAASRMGKREQALQAEQRYFNQHLQATENRHRAATQVDKERIRHGDTLGWYAKMDSITSAECKAANGRNFQASKIPPIGYPGAVHPHCRCRAGKAHATSRTVYDIKPDRRAA